jgi:hypothetical protein
MADLLPPDGVPWPPEPVRRAEAGEPQEVLPTPPSKRDSRSSDVPDWRTLRNAQTPEGYAGSATAPAPTAKPELYGIAALVLAVTGAVLLATSVSVVAPILGLLAVALGLEGSRRARVAPELHTLKWLGAIVAGAVVAVGVGVLLYVVVTSRP